MLIATALAAGSMLACPPLEGSQRLWERPRVRYVFVGEIHGTVQTPELFGDLVCNAAAARARPVVVALEAPDAEQPAIDRFLSSDGGADAQEVFKRSFIWTNTFKDGRSSVAYFALFQRLREMKARGLVERVVAFQPTEVSERTRSQTGYNAVMAERLRSAAHRDPRALLLVLVGNVHARKRPVPFGSVAIIPAAADLPADLVISLNAPVVGEAWICVAAGCGPHRLEGEVRPGRAVILAPSPDAAFDGELRLGEPATASPPVVRADGGPTP